MIFFSLSRFKRRLPIAFASLKNIYNKKNYGFIFGPPYGRRGDKNIVNKFYLITCFTAVSLIE